MQLRLNATLAFLDEHPTYNGRQLAGLLRGIASATPGSDLFMRDHDAEREAEVKKLRKLKSFLLRYSKLVTDQMIDLRKELEP